MSFLWTWGYGKQHRETPTATPLLNKADTRTELTLTPHCFYFIPALQFKTRVKLGSIKKKRKKKTTIEKEGAFYSGQRQGLFVVGKGQGGQGGPVVLE